jgi:MOSC domain-containing protein YiiM
MSQQIESASLVSLNVGKPIALAHGSKEVVSGIIKQPSAQPLALSFTGLEGDGQGDLVNHGGPDKAVCAYFEQRYPYWRSQFDNPFQFGAFGENFTLSEWTEDDLYIGDIVQAGEAVLQVSQPRQPCFKLGIRHQLPELPLQVQLTGYTGFYFRVLQEGRVKAGTPLSIAQRHPARITIAEANRVMYKDKEDQSGIIALLEVQELAASWQKQLGKRLDKLKTLE